MHKKDHSYTRQELYLMLNLQHQNKKKSDLGRFERVMVVGLSISETLGIFTHGTLHGLYKVTLK